MKVLLFRPTTNLFKVSDLGFGYLAAALKRANHTPYVLDYLNERFTFDKFERFIAVSDFDVIGFKVLSMDLRIAKECLRIVKAINPKIVTIIGGAHPSIAPQQSLEYFTEADFAFVGEAEIGLVKLLNNLFDLDSGKKSHIPGMVWRDNGSIVSNPPMFVKDLDLLGMPEWGLINPRNYNFQSACYTKSKVVAPIILTRGCDHICSFCPNRKVSGTGIRSHSVDYVMDEIELLYSHFGIRELFFIDENFLSNKKYVEDLCNKILENNLKLSWSAYGVRIDHLEEGILKLMERAGCYSISVGIESGSQRILDHMNKRLTIDVIREKLALVHSVTDIQIKGYFILGYPIETEADIRQTIRFSRSLPIFAPTFHKFHIFPGTPIYEEMIREKKISKEEVFEELVRGCVKYRPIKISSLNFSLLYIWAHISFFGRPKVILTIIKKMSNFGMAKFLLCKLRDVLSIRRGI